MPGGAERRTRRQRHATPQRLANNPPLVGGSTSKAARVFRQEMHAAIGGGEAASTPHCREFQRARQGRATRSGLINNPHAHRTRQASHRVADQAEPGDIRA
jgi:hypothetical protein